MTRTQYYTATSIDGFIADPEHSLEWLFKSGAGLDETGYPEFIAEVGPIAMGSSTYEWLLRNHIRPEQGEPQPWPYEMPAWIFSSRELPKIEGADLRFVSGDVRPVHEQMVAAAGGKNIWVVGGGDLAGQFHDAGLLDELIFQVAPVTLGAGSPLLPRRIEADRLKLTAVNRYGPFVELRYTIGAPVAL